MSCGGLVDNKTRAYINATPLPGVQKRLYCARKVSISRLLLIPSQPNNPRNATNSWRCYVAGATSTLQLLTFCGLNDETSKLYDEQEKHRMRRNVETRTKEMSAMSHARYVSGTASSYLTRLA